MKPYIVVELPHQRTATAWIAWDGDQTIIANANKSPDHIYEPSEWGSELEWAQDVLFSDLNSHYILETRQEVRDFLKTYKRHQWLAATRAVRAIYHEIYK